MSNQYLLWEVDTEVDSFGACTILEFAADRKKSWIIASDYLVFDEPLLEGVSLFERAVVFLEYFEQTLIDLLWYAHIGVHVWLYKNYNDSYASNESN